MVTLQGLVCWPILGWAVLGWAVLGWAVLVLSMCCEDIAVVGGVL